MGVDAVADVEALSVCCFLSLLVGYTLRLLLRLLSPYVTIRHHTTAWVRFEVVVVVVHRRSCA